MQKYNWENVLPVNSIAGGFLISNEFEFTGGIKIKYPPVFTLNRDNFKAIEDGISANIKVLPDNTVYHQLDYYYTREHEEEFSGDEDYITKENKLIFHKKPVLLTHSYIFITFGRKSRRKKGTENSYLRGKKSNPFNPLKVKLSDKEIDEYNFILESFINGMESLNDVSCQRMSDDELGIALYEYLSGEYDREIGPDEWEDQLLPNFYHDGNDVRLGESYVGVVSLVGEGKILESYKAPSVSDVKESGVDFDNKVNLKASYFYPVGLGLPINHVVSTSIEVKNNEDIELYLNNDKRQIGLLASIGHQKAVNKKLSIEEFIRGINSENTRPCYLTQSVIISEKDPHKIRRYKDLAKRAYETINSSKAYIENLEAANLYFANCPGNILANYRTMKTVVDQAVCYLQKEHPVESDQQGHVYLDRPYGNPVVYNMFDSPYIVNRNKIIIGPSGSGKSFWINNYVNQALNLGHQVILIDIGRSYESNVHLYDEITGRGKFIDAENKKSLSFNPFLFGKKDGKYQLDNEESRKLTTLKTLIEWVWKGDEKVMKNEDDLLRHVIITYYDWINETEKFPCLNTFYEFTKVYEQQHLTEERKGYVDFEAMRMAFEVYKSGENAYLLNAEQIIDVSNDKFIVFELEAVMKDSHMLGLLSLIIMDLVLDKVEYLPMGERLTFGIDEGLDFLKNPVMGDFIAYLYRTFRKKYGEIFLAAQNVEFLDEATTEIYRSITANTDTHIILDHSNYKSSYKDLQRVLSLVKQDVALLDSLKKTKEWREFLLKMGNKSWVLRNKVAPFAIGVYSSEKDHKDKIRERYNYHGNLKVAINEFINQ